MSILPPDFFLSLDISNPNYTVEIFLSYDFSFTHEFLIFSNASWFLRKLSCIQRAVMLAGTSFASVFSQALTILMTNIGSAI